MPPIKMMALADQEVGQIRVQTGPSATRDLEYFHEICYHSNVTIVPSPL